MHLCRSLPGCPRSVLSCFGANSENQRYHESCSQVLRLSLTEGQSGAVALPLWLLQSGRVGSPRFSFLPNIEAYSKKGPSPWDVVSQTQSPDGLREMGWFFFYVIFSFTAVLDILLFSAPSYMKLTRRLRLNGHLLSVFSTHSWRNRCQRAIAVQ